MSRLHDDMIASTPAPPAAFHLAHTVWWDHLVQHAGVSIEDDPGSTELGGSAVVLDAALDELRLVPADHQQLWVAALMRRLALDEAKRRGLHATSEAIRDRANQLCSDIGVTSDDAFTAWLEATGVDLVAFNELIGEQVVIDQVVALTAPSAMGGLIDTLRTADRYDVVTRALDKERLLSSHGLDNPSLVATGLADEAALTAWWATRVGSATGDDRTAEAAAAGFADVTSFVRALIREHLYVGLQSTELPS